MVAAKALIIGISGPSCSGKTTLARLLRRIYPNSFILHEDDFYKADADIPVTSTGVQDWDCLEALDLPGLEKALRHIRQHGGLPPDFNSKEDQNSVGKAAVDDKVVDDLEWKASKWLYADVPPIALVDGFLLYSERMQGVRDLIDVKLLVRTDYETAKARREARSGYVTLEGFWTDPPGYVEEVVWPNYTRDHAFLFKDGDVEGELDEAQLQKFGIHAMSVATDGLDGCLQWAYRIVDEALERNTTSPSRP